MADDPSPLTPDFDTVREVAVAATRGVVSNIPGIGGVIDAAVFGPMDLAARKRDVDFLRELDRRVRLLADELDGWDVDRIVTDLAFIAAVHRVTRAAQEEASDAKRLLLLNALAHAGSWGAEPALTRARFLDLVVRFSELHVFLLRYFIDPEAWLREHAPAWRRDGILGGSLSSVLERWVFPDDPVWPEEVDRAVAELSGERLLDLGGLNTFTTGASLYNRHTTSRGQRFLDFLAEPPT